MSGNKLGPYELIEEIGHGGMATVYRAYQPNVDRYVAVKVIHRAVAQDSKTLERFTREARLVARLEHPHILPVYDYDGHSDPPYIVMRYMPTGTLKDILEHEQLPFAEVAFLLGQIASALDYAHRQGVVHRDIKPSNIMVDGDGNAFLTDFGIARMVESSEGLTASGMAIGTPGYMAPEQGLGLQIDGRADIYSLGVMIYEMLAGKVPFSAETPMAVILKHINDPIPDVTRLNPNLPAAVDTVIRRAMAKQVEERYATATELSRALTIALGATSDMTPVRLQAIASQTMQDLQRERQALTEERTVTDRPLVRGQPTPGAAPSVSTSQTVPRVQGAFAGAGIVLLLLLLVGATLLFVTNKNNADQTAAALAAAATGTHESQQTLAAIPPTMTMTAPPPTVATIPTTVQAPPPTSMPPTVQPTRAPTLPPTSSPTINPTLPPTVPPTRLSNPIPAAGRTETNPTHTATTSPTKTATHTPTPVPPTPTNTPSNTPTVYISPTPIVVSIQILTISESTDQKKFVVSIQTVNQQLIKSYRAQLISQADGLLMGEWVFSVPPYDTITLPFKELNAGSYLVKVNALDERDSVLAQSLFTVTYVPPTATPTYTPTHTPTFTPSATFTHTSVPPTLTPTLTPSATPTFTPVPPTLAPTLTPTFTPLPPTLAPTSSTLAPVPPTLTPAPAATISVTPQSLQLSGRLPYVNDMEASNALDGWDYDPALWRLQAESGRETLVGSGDFHSPAVVMGAKAPEWSDPKLTSLLISLNMNLDTVSSIGRIGFRYGPSGYYVVEVRVGGLVIKRGKSSDLSRIGDEKIVAQVINTTVRNGAWNSYQIWSEANRLFIYLNQHLVLFAEDSGDTLPGGAILFQSYNKNFRVRIDNIKIQRPLEASEHFRTADWPNTWNRSNTAGAVVATDPKGAGFVDLTAGKISPVIPPLADVRMVCRLWVVSGGFEMRFRESSGGAYLFQFVGGDLNLSDLDGTGKTVQKWSFPNFYGRADYFDFTVETAGDQIHLLTTRNDYTETAKTPPPPGGISFSVNTNDELRLTDCLFVENAQSATENASWAFDKVAQIEASHANFLLDSWPDNFTGPIADFWEGGFNAPGQYKVNGSDPKHTNYLEMKYQDGASWRLFRFVKGYYLFGPGQDKTTYKDSSDIYLNINVRVPNEGTAWVAARTSVSVGKSSLNGYRLELTKQADGTYLVAARGYSLAASPTYYQGLVPASADGTTPDWVPLLIITYQNNVAFFANGRLLAATNNATILDGTVALGVNTGTTADFEHMQLRSVNPDRR